MDSLEKLEQIIPLSARERISKFPIGGYVGAATGLVITAGLTYWLANESFKPDTITPIVLSGFFGLMGGSVGGILGYTVHNEIRVENEEAKNPGLKGKIWKWAIEKGYILGSDPSTNQINRTQEREMPAKNSGDTTTNQNYWWTDGSGTFGGH